MNRVGDSYVYVTGADNEANLYSTFDLLLELTDANGNVVKKIVVPVKVVKPEFSDYFKENTYAGWVDGELTRIFNDASFTPNTANIFVKANNTVTLSPTDIAYTYSYKDKSANNADVEDASTIEQTKFFKKGAQIGSTENYLYSFDKQYSVTAKASITVAKVSISNNETQTAKETKNIPATTSFNMNIQQQFTAELVYLNDDVESDIAPVNTAATDGTLYIQKYYESVPANDETGAPAKYSGLAIKYADKYIAVNSNSTGVKHNGFTIKGMTTLTAKPSADNISYTVGTDGTSVGTPTLTTDGLTFTNLNANEGGVLKLTFVDELGIVSTATIKYKHSGIVADEE